jgi:hypothetical protein
MANTDRTTEVGHGVLKNFTSPIVGVAGYYPLGRHMHPTGGFQQVIVATEDGKVTELFWRPGEGVNEEELFAFSSKISGIAAYYSEDDGFHHQDVALEDGTLHELFFQPGPGVNHGVLKRKDEFTTSPIVGVAAYFVTEDGFHHQIVATEDNTLHELFWLPGPDTPVNHGVLREFDSSIVGVDAFDTPDGFQHQIVATEDGNVHQLWFRPGPEPANHRVLQGFASPVLGVAAYYTPDGYRRAIVATEDGKVQQLFWKPGEDINQEELHEFAPRIVEVAGYFSYGDNRQHVIVASDDGDVHELFFGIEDDLGYPGDTASKPAIAKWMARCAEEEFGLPPELPVMTSLVELGTGEGFGWNEALTNVRDGFGYSVAVDHLSLGFFQQQPFFLEFPNWGCRRQEAAGNSCTVQQRRENIMYAPHAILEFLDAAELVRAEFGFSNADESSFGVWCQTVQRSAFPLRYQEELPTARNLINS